MIFGSGSKCSVVGDDALGVFAYEDEVEEGEVPVDTQRDIFRQLSLFGKLAFEKTAFLPAYDPEVDPSKNGWVYLKRRLMRFEDGLHLDDQLAFPSIGLFAEKNTTRRMNYDMSRKEVIPRIATQIFQFLRQLSRIQYVPKEKSLLLVWWYLTSLYRHFNLPHQGLLPSSEKTGLERGSSAIFILPYLRADATRLSELLQDPLKLTVLRCPMHTACLPILSFHRIRPWPEFRRGEVFEATGQKAIHLATEWGYLECEAMTEEIIGEEAIRERILHWMDRNSRLVYRYTVVREVPDMLSTLYFAM